MEKFESNSHKAKEEPLRRPPDKRLEKVVSGETTAKKKTEARKFAEAFVKDDLSSIGRYIVTDVLVPAVKRTILDSVKALLGETGGSAKGTVASKVSYRSFYDDRDVAGRTAYNNVPAKIGFDYDDILFTTRGDAEIVLEAMYDVIKSQYGVVSVGDMYDLANVSTDNYTLNNYGWTDLHGAKAVPVTGGYVLKLPRALPLK